MIDILMVALIGFNLIVLVYFGLLNLFYLWTSVFSFRALRKYARRLNTLDVDELVTSAGAPPVTIVMPAYNEEANCVSSVRSLLALRYPEHEVIVVNDGSKDGTLAKLMEAFQLAPAVRAPTSQLATAPIRMIYRSRRHPTVWVIDKENGGKADALNAGINYCHTPLFCAMDADSILEREALMRLVRPFLEDGTTVAAGGIVRIANGCDINDGFISRVRLPRSLLARFQVLEYLRAFLAGRMGWSALDVLLIVSGAFGIFRRSAVVEAGGYARDTVGEDMELIVRLHRHFRERKQPYRISFIPDPIAWTEAPETMRVLARQRDRWQRGMIQSLARHRKMLLNPRFGRIGMVAFPYFWFLEGFGPVVEILGYVSFVVALALGWASPPFIVAFLLLAFFFGVALSAASVALEELVFRRYTSMRDFARLLVLAVAENFGYRQLLTLFRFRGVLSALWGRGS
ncbi:MAG: glycosyltransferase family 2 protein, partial [Gemmatimonadetes bacterium]|nr:glycosyltransferase family 2 protein [Gemmatimonadota bacterium]